MQVDDAQDVPEGSPWTKLRSGWGPGDPRLPGAGAGEPSSMRIDVRRLVALAMLVVLADLLFFDRSLACPWPFSPLSWRS